MVANTWIAAAPGDWSDDANWSLGHSPIAGEDPTFDGTSTNNCVANDDTPTGVLTIAAGYSGTINQASDMHITGYSQAGGTFTGVTTKWVYCIGNFVWSSGILTEGVLNLEMAGDNKILSYHWGTLINGLKITGTCQLPSTQSDWLYITGAFPVITGTLTLNKSTFGISVVNANNLGITGLLNGVGIFRLYDTDASRTGNFNNITCNIRIEGHVALSTSRTFTLNADTNCGSIIILSAHATYTQTVNLNGHSLTATTITIGTRGILANSGALANVNCTTFDASAGTFTPDRTVLVMEGASTIKLAAGGSVDNLISKGVTALASDVTVSNVCAHVNPINNGAFALALTNPDQEYTGLKRPIIIPVKQLAIGAVTAASRWLKDLGAVI